MYIQRIIRDNIKSALNEIFQFNTDNIELQQTKKEFEGDVTLVIFPMVKELKSSPKEIAEKISYYINLNSGVTPRVKYLSSDNIFYFSHLSILFLKYFL